MNRRFALIACLALIASPLAAATPTARHKPAPPAPAAPLGDTVRVAMVTELGTVELDLDHAHAPITVENFVRYADRHLFDGMTFYRAMKLAWGDQPNGLVQAGLRGDPRKVLPAIAHEPTSKTGIHHTAGTISMARFAPGTATADFSILLSDLKGFDADPTSSDPEAQAGYAAFGHVVSGMDVVRRIFAAPTSPTLGEGVMKGQMLAPPIKVLTVRRVPVQAPSASPAP